MNNLVRLQRVIFAFSFVFLFSITTVSAELPDIDGDGYQDIYYFNNGGTEIYNADSDLLATIPIPANLRESDALLFAGKWLNEPSVASMTIEGPNNAKSGTVHILTQNGLVTSFSIGAFSQHDTVIAFDFDNSGLTDLAIVNESGSVVVHNDPGLQQGGTRTLSIPGDTTSFFAPTRDVSGTPMIAAFVPQSKRGRKSRRSRRKGAKRLTLSIVNALNGSVSSTATVKKMKGQPIPMADGFLIPKNIKRNTSKYNVIDQNGRRVANFKGRSEARFVSGLFRDGSGMQLLAAEGDFAEILDLSLRAASLGFVQFSPSLGSGGLGGGLGGGTGGGNSGGGSNPPATDAQIESLLDDLRSAVGSFNFGQIEAVLAMLTSLNTTQAQQDHISNQIGNILNFGIQREFQIESVSTPVGNVVKNPILQLERGVPVSGDAGGLTKDKLGCEVYRNPNDGAEGFLYRNADHGGVVMLAPAGLYTDKQGFMLNPKTGKVITKMNNTGVANGGRVHFRASGVQTSYPRHIVFRIPIGFPGTPTTNYCWEVKNSYGRVD